MLTLFFPFHFSRMKIERETSFTWSCYDGGRIWNIVCSGGPSMYIFTLTKKRRYFSSSTCCTRLGMRFFCLSKIDPSASSFSLFFRPKSSLMRISSHVSNNILWFEYVVHLERLSYIIFLSPASKQLIVSRCSSWQNLPLQFL